MRRRWAWLLLALPLLAACDEEDPYGDSYVQVRNGTTEVCEGGQGHSQTTTSFGPRGQAVTSSYYVSDPDKCRPIEDRSR